MADIKDKNATIPKTGAKKPEPSAAPDCPLPEPTISKGEKLFNWGVYSGLNYWVNLISSVAISDYFTNGRGRAQLDSVIRPLAASLEMTKLMKPEKFYKQTKVAVETLTLLSGGWLLLIPLKIMEDHKRPMVHWLNKKLGVAQRGADGHELTADEIYIEQEQPKQTWWNVIKRRIYATGVVVASGSILEHVAGDKSKPRPTTFEFQGKTYTEQGHMGGKERVTEMVAEKVNLGMNAITGSHKFGTDPNTWGQRWLRLAVLDSVFTKMTAMVMYFTNGAKKQAKTNKSQHKPAPPQNADSPVVMSEPAQDTGTKKFMDKVRPSSNTADISYTQRIMNEPTQTAQQGV